MHGVEFLPQCLICVKTLSYSAVKLSLVMRHLVTNQFEEKEQDENYFQRLERMQKDNALSRLA